MNRPIIASGLLLNMWIECFQSFIFESFFSFQSSMKGFFF